MTEIDTSTNPVAPRRRRFQFGLGSLFLVMLVCSVMAAAGYYSVRSSQQDAEFKAAQDAKPAASRSSAGSSQQKAAVKSMKQPRPTGVPFSVPGPQNSGGANRLIFILFTLVAPIVLVIVVSVLWQVAARLGRRR